MAHHIIGQSGTGKTALLRELITAETRPGLCVFDTSGMLSDTVRYDVLFDPETTRWNPFDEPVDRDLAPNLFANTIVDLLGHSGRDRPLWIVNLALNCRFLASAFIDGKRDLTEIPAFLFEQAERDKLNILDPGTRQYWHQYDTLPPRERTAQTASTYNLFSQLLLDSRVRRLFHTSRTKLSLAALGERRLLVRLPIDRYGADAVSFIGSLVLAYVLHFAPRGYAVYLDDCDLFAPGVVRGAFTRGRADLTLAHQYFAQLSPELQSALLGNAEKRSIFRVSKADAEHLAKDLPPMSAKKSLDELPRYSYRQIPYSLLAPDGLTIPLEKIDESDD